MLTGFNGATSMKYDLLSDIVSASEAGFDVLEIWKTKLFEALKNHSMADILSNFVKHGIEPYSINSLEQATFSRDFKEKLEECEMLCTLAQDVRAKVLIVVPGFIQQELSQEEIKKETVGTLKEFSKLADHYEIKLAFEFLGFRNCSVNNLNLARQIVESVGRKNVGLVIDTCHLFAGGSTLKDVENTDPSTILIVHINDLPKIEKRQVQDSDRVMPTDGILPLSDFIKTLRKIGYSGVISVELFNEEYWKLDSKQIAQISYEKLAKLL
ncbi:MAG TPA: sugar phosphate isomerase/epimerase [Pseudothermotoga sp.]|nr:sugar phosphate isomerase/epimerase [Pseudothermotoga sp.]HOK84510.1 sugar phosphate isomerase/epimerase [Pseudothermotoga sp.]HPP69392.1 sugar phosphate isomerase/epimerase [Pseudothermotoga sp.]